MLRTIATSQRLPAALLSFEPTPREFFAKAVPPARLTRFREKLRGTASVRGRAVRVPAVRRGAALDERRGIHRRCAGQCARCAARRRRARLQVRAQHGGQRRDAACRGSASRVRSHRGAAVRDRRRARQQFADPRGAGRGRHGARRTVARATVPDDRQGRRQVRSSAASWVFRQRTCGRSGARRRSQACSRSAFRAAVCTTRRELPVSVPGPR